VVHRQYTLAKQPLHSALQGGDLRVVEEPDDVARHGLGERGDVL
jgi:hypothetical protein